MSGGGAASEMGLKGWVSWRWWGEEERGWKKEAGLCLGAEREDGRCFSVKFHIRFLVLYVPLGMSPGLSEPHLKHGSENTSWAGVRTD